MAPTKTKVLIVATGGTMVMGKSSSGYRPSPGYLAKMIAENSMFHSGEMPDIEVRELDPLLDSADMTPDRWWLIAREIEARYDQHDGFVVVHGTDTMAYTASALSFMLENLSKPVLLTGSQIPPCEIRNDAVDNLLGALLLIGRFGRHLAEVFVYFDNTLLRGNRSTKVDSDAFAAFESPNFPVVGKVGIEIDVELPLTRKPTSGKPMAVVELGTATVAVIRLFPGIKADYVENMLSYPVQGVVLECFGSGTGPSRNGALMKAFGDAVNRGVVVTAVCQPVRGTADLTTYETSRALRNVGVVSGFDMTCEAALAKLFFLFAKGFSPRKVSGLMGRNLRGELTPPGKGARLLERNRDRLKSFRPTDADE